MQLSCVSSSSELGDRVKYPNHFQLLAPDADLADGFLAIIKQFGWKKVALIVQEENLLTTVSFKYTSRKGFIWKAPPPPQSDFDCLIAILSFQ